MFVPEPESLTPFVEFVTNVCVLLASCTFISASSVPSTTVSAVNVTGLELVPMLAPNPGATYTFLAVKLPVVIDPDPSKNNTLSLAPGTTPPDQLEAVPRLLSPEPLVQTISSTVGAAFLYGWVAGS